MRTLILASSAALLVACQPEPAPSPTPAPEPAAAWPHPSIGAQRPLVIAHRGASGLLPEHTIEAYKLAIEQGADCIEPDLVMTKDGVLVSRHDIYLSTTTNVTDRAEFADRKRAATDAEHDGMEDWFVSDFTLDEIRTLRARQAFRGRSAEHDDQYLIPTFAEVLDLAIGSSTPDGEPVCVYPEAKAPALHASLGFDMGGEILRVLDEKGLAAAGSPVFIQSFEPPFVKEMNDRTDLPVVMLVGGREALATAMAVEGAPFWDGLGATHQTLFLDEGMSSGVLESAHASGIAVHTWTYRDDAPFGAEPVETSMRKALALGVDGFFTDFPATGVRVVDALAQPAPE